MFFRSLFCQYNAEELDELLHTDPIYRRPERIRSIQTSQSSAGYSSFSPLLSESASNPQDDSQTKPKSVFGFLSRKNKNVSNRLIQNDQAQNYITPNFA